MIHILWTIPLTIFIYGIIFILQKKFKQTWLNPLLTTSLILIAFLLLTGINYDTYKEGSQLITFFIGPATVSLALPLYEKMDLFKKHWKLILITIFIGVIVHAITIGLIVVIMNSDTTMLATFIPKSVTTAIAIDISSSLGGIKYLTVTIVVLTGVFGVLIAPPIFKLFKINDPIARGLSLGASAHAVGTSKAIEYGSVEASMSTLALIFTGLMTVLLSPVIYKIIELLIT